MRETHYQIEIIMTDKIYLDWPHNIYISNSVSACNSELIKHDIIDIAKCQLHVWNIKSLMDSRANCWSDSRNVLSENWDITTQAEMYNYDE